jgi:hypothetical protein
VKKLETLSEKETVAKRAGGVAQVAKCLLSLRENLGSSPSIGGRQEKEKEIRMCWGRGISRGGQGWKC